MQDIPVLKRETGDPKAARPTTPTEEAPSKEQPT